MERTSILIYIWPPAKETIMAVNTTPKKLVKADRANNLTDKYNELKAIFQEVEIDLPKFQSNNNKSAGIRVRKAMRDIKIIAQDIRMQILASSK